MPRVCVCGCGKALLSKNGQPDYRRYFYDPKVCKKNDKAEKMRLKRQRKPKRSPKRVWITVRGKKVGMLTVKAAFDLGRAEGGLPATAKTRVEKMQLKLRASENGDRRKK